MKLLVRPVSRRHTPSRTPFVPEGVTNHEESSPNAVRHLRPERQRPRSLRRRPRRPRPEPARQARLARRLLQVLVAERAPRRQAHQHRPRPLPGGDPGDGPRAGAGERPRHRRGPRPAPLRVLRADLRRSVRDGHRDPRRELEARRQDRGELARELARLRAAPARRHARRQDRRRRRDGRAAAHLVHQARYRAQRAPAHRRGDEVGRRPGPPPRQPRR